MAESDGLVQHGGMRVVKSLLSLNPTVRVEWQGEMRVTAMSTPLPEGLKCQAGAYVVG